MKWSKRAAEIAALRAKHGKRRPNFMPDLSTEQRTAPCSNVLAPIHRRVTVGAHHPDAQSFPVGQLHKQGPVLITPGDIAGGQLKFFGGGKPNHTNLTE
jgi:hypothetical protein